MTITFGLIEGWWRSIDPYRTNGPLISVLTWQSLLHKAGFTAVKGHGSANQQVLVAYFDGNHGYPSASIIAGTESDIDAGKTTSQAINIPDFEEKASSHDRSNAAAVTITELVGGSQLRWQCLGNGHPLLLLPPLNMSINAWIQQITLLEGSSYAVHVPVYPGHLDNPLEKQSFSFAALVDELCDYIKKHWPEEAVPVVGWSLGGCLALGLACRAPELVTALVLVNSMAKPDENLLANVSKLDDELCAHTDYLAALLNSQRSVPEELRAGASTQVLMHYYQMLSNIDLREHLPRIMIPSLVVHGQRDPVILASDLEELRQLGNVKIVKLETAGHFIPLLAAQYFNALLLDFLSMEHESL